MHSLAFVPSGFLIGSSKSLTHAARSCGRFPRARRQRASFIVASTVDAPNAGNNDTPSPSPRSDLVPLRLFGAKFEVSGHWMLYAVPMLWATWSVVLRVVHHWPGAAPSMVFNALRLIVSTLFFVPALVKVSENKSPGKNEKKWSFVSAGVELGFIIFIAVLAQVWGAKFILASRSGFIVQTQMVMVPLVSAFLGVESLRARDFVAALMAIGGMFLLTLDTAAGLGTAKLLGDLLTLASAFVFSLYIVRLGTYAKTMASTPLVAMKVIAQAFFSTIWIFLEQHVFRLLRTLNLMPPAAASKKASLVASKWTLGRVAGNAALVIWCALFVSCLASWLQTKGQATISSNEAVVIYSTTPLWTVVFSALFLGERFGIKGALGGVLILVASLYSGGFNPFAAKKSSA